MRIQVWPIPIVAAALAIQVIATGCDGESSAQRESHAAPAGAEGSWQRIHGPVGRADGFQELAPVRVGDKVVVIAGVDYEGRTLKGIVIDGSSARWNFTAPSGLRWRYGHAAVSAGNEVIVWGGCCGSTGPVGRASGAIYDVERDRWTRLGPGPLGNRFNHTAVWTGEEMVVWGGSAGSRRGGVRADGAAYDPSADRWRMIASAPLTPRQAHTAVWTGEEMIVWGGSKPLPRERERLLDDGAAYDPGRDTWRRIAATQLLGGRATLPAGLEPDLDAEWTGEEMTIWSRYGAASYEPESDQWARIPAPPREIRRVVGGQTVWSGSELIVWGGEGGDGSNVEQGAAWDPSAHRWRALPVAAIRGRDRHAAVSTPRGMVIWGGCCRRSDYYSDGAVYVTEE